MITRDEADGLRDQLLAVLAEDARNTQRLLARLESMTHETGIGAHAALLLILTHQAFEESEARRHWVAILAHREQFSAALGRDAGVRVAMLDYFMNINRHLVQPTLIDLELLEASETPSSEDKLTGLQTDRMLRNAVQTELRRARRYRQKAALVLFDLDNFADVNARLGRLVGDRLLRETAILLSNNSRDIDLAARPGDDEFAVLLPEADRNGAVLVAERFRREVDEFFSRREGAGKPIGLTVSAGVACYPDDASSPETLLENVAMALYQAKALGKNVVHAYQPERRRYLRFDLEPGRFEVEVLSPPDRRLGRTRNLSRNGILFTSPEALDVGEEIEIRLLDSAGEAATRSLRIRGLVVRLEELPEPQTPPLTTDTVDDRYEVGVAYDLDGGASTDDLFDFLQQQSRQGGQRS